MSIELSLNEFFDRLHSLDLSEDVCLDVNRHLFDMIKSQSFHTLCVNHAYIVAVFRTLANVGIIGQYDFSNLHLLLDDIFQAVHKDNGLSVC